MARRWTKAEERSKYKELNKLYVEENKSIREVAKILDLGESTVYDRLLRLSIKPIRSKKLLFNNKRNDFIIPSTYSESLAETIGVLLGDGHITPTQVTVTLGNKEEEYVYYVAGLLKEIFSINPKIIKTKKGYFVIYFGSTDIVRWLLSMGLVFNKVRSQVGAPSWIFFKKEYMKGFLRGFFDTDGSIYKLKFGLQISLTNRSIPLLKSLRRCLVLLDYSPSKISQFHVYLTRRNDISRFFEGICPANIKHKNRFKTFSIVK